MDSVSRFTATVANYVKYRPSYPKELFSFLNQRFSSNSSNEIAELGAGTGIFTRQLLLELKCLNKLYAIEPNDEMRKEAEESSPLNEKLKILKGTAEKTNLLSKQVNGVLAAQSFHWFKLDQTLKEIELITKPESFCAAIWNDRALDSKFNSDLEKVLLRYSKPYESLARPQSTIERLLKLIPSGKEIKFNNSQILTLDNLIGRMSSTSYVVHGVEDLNSFNNELEIIFNNHQENNQVNMKYETRVFYWVT